MFFHSHRSHQQPSSSEDEEAVQCGQVPKSSMVPGETAQHSTLCGTTAKPSHSHWKS